MLSIAIYYPENPSILRILILTIDTTASSKIIVHFAQSVPPVPV